MDDQKGPPEADSDIAAALEAIAPVGVADVSPSDEIISACEALSADGTRPTIRAVYAYLMAEYGKAPSFRDLSPVVRTWRAGRWKSPAVRRAFRAYQKLDAEQKEAFRELVETDNVTSARADHGKANYEISATLLSGRVVVEHAHRKTHAWVKYYNLRDRHRRESIQVTISERLEDGTTEVIKQWTKRGLTRW
ncbi:MAG: DNA-binding protein [Phycisphaerales bacterium]|nr:DNA-binding protein [Phycisphaerales bacterium]